MPNPMIVAHRGVPFQVRENTLASFAKAIEIGADMIEFDVRRTKDRTMVVYHDPDIDGRPLYQLTYKQVNDLAVAKDFNIPQFEEVLALTQNKIKLDVELKEFGYENEVADMIRNFFQNDDFVVTSFQDQTIAVIKHKFPTIKAGLLLGDNPLLPLLFSMKDFFPESRCQACGADFIAVNYHLLHCGFLNRAIKNHKQVYVWTVDEPKLLANLLIDQRIHAVITNRPDLALKLKMTS